MLSLKIIQTSFKPTKPAVIPSTDSRSSGAKKHSLIWPCRSGKSDDSNSGSESSPPPSEGDPRWQELLAQIAILETEKVRLADYLDDQAAYLTQFAKEANAEMDAIAENAFKDLDEASARIMESMDSKMQEYEESAEKNRQEIAKSDKEIADFESEFERSKNEGMFFKSLGEPKTPPNPVVKAEAREEANKIKELTREINATSKSRRNIYLIFVGLLAAGVADSLVSDSPDWRKTAVLSAILVALLAQLAYEQRILSETEKKQVEKKDEKKE